jgi:hypothetical protein
MNKDINTKKINNIVHFLEYAKQILERILGDVQLYENYFDNIISDISISEHNSLENEYIIKKLQKISEIFYKSIVNHLSIVNTENGFEKIIKNVTKEEKNITIKFNGMKKLYGEKYIQTNLVVGSIDNISINPMILEESIIGYEFCIGKNKYLIDEKYDKYIKDINILIKEKKNIIENIEISLITNIDFISKYINAFLTNIG